MLCSSCGAVNPSGSRFCMSCGKSLEPVELGSVDPPSGDAPLEPVQLGSVDPPSEDAPPEPVDVAPADLSGADPVVDPVSDPEPPSSEPASSGWPSEPPSEPVSADLPNEPLAPATPSEDAVGWGALEATEPEPPSAEPTSAPAPAPAWEAPAAEPTSAPAQTWGPSVSSDAPSQPAWSPPSTSAPAPAPAWQQPAASTPPAWAPPPAAAPAAQPMPPPPNPSPGDPFALGAAAQRLEQSSQAAARSALLATAAIMVQGERVEAVTQGRIEGVAGVVTLTDRRLAVINQRDWAPFVTWFTIDPQLDVQAWEDQSGATVVLTGGGRQVTVEGITDKQPAYELVARLRARLGR